MAKLTKYQKRIRKAVRRLNAVYDDNRLDLSGLKKNDFFILLPEFVQNNIERSSNSKIEGTFVFLVNNGDGTERVGCLPKAKKKAKRAAKKKSPSLEDVIKPFRDGNRAMHAAILEFEKWLKGRKYEYDARMRNAPGRDEVNSIMNEFYELFKDYLIGQ